jgi:hypothetical protein
MPLIKQMQLLSRIKEEQKEGSLPMKKSQKMVKRALKKRRVVTSDH